MVRLMTHRAKKNREIHQMVVHQMTAHSREKHQKTIHQRVVRRNRVQIMHSPAHRHQLIVL